MHSHFPHTHHYCTAKPLNCTFCPHATQPVEWMVTFWCHLETRKKYNTYNKDALHTHMIKIILLVYCNSDSSMSLTTRGYKAISYLEVNGEGGVKREDGALFQWMSPPFWQFMRIYFHIDEWWVRFTIWRISLFSSPQLPAATNWQDHVPGAMKKLISGAQQK